MLQFDAKSRVSLITGRSGAGKTTFALRYLVAEKSLQCRFLFDPEGEYSAKLKLPPVETVEEFPFAVEDGFVCFCPHTLFPGNLSGAFAWFCDYVFHASTALPGRKLMLVDEAWKYCSPNSIPQTLANVLQTGRKRGLESMFATQRPNKLNESILNEVTELVYFSLQGRNAIKILADTYDVDPEDVQALDLGQYVSFSINSGEERRGAMWGASPGAKKSVAVCQRKPSNATEKSGSKGFSR